MPFDTSWVNESNTLTTKEDNLQPPRNFYRLNLLEPNNSQYSSCDLDEQTTNIQCFSNEYKCFDDNLYYVCKKNVDKPIYLISLDDSLQIKNMSEKHIFDENLTYYMKQFFSFA